MALGSAAFQLSFELTNVFGAGRQAVSAVKRAIDFSRDLRKSGSDIVVEEDLADIFGRMKINGALEARFKQEVLANHTITPLHPNSDFQLHAGPGPTLNRALGDQDRRYLSTVVQLSLLAWVHDRTELASSLGDCMRRRFEMNVPGANIDPGFEGILSTLEACSAQTSSFEWSRYTGAVRELIMQSYPPMTYRKLYARNVIEHLPANTLLAVMDYLCLVQSLPEDRKIVIQSHAGMIPLIVWCHYILGLSVHVTASGGQTVNFGNTETAQVLILFDSESASGSDGTTDILLLDKDLNIVLKCGPESDFTNTIKLEERHPLTEYGTEHLHRFLNTSIHTPRGNTLYQETAQLILALVITRSKTLCRVAVSDPDYACRDDLPSVNTLERWRLFDAASLIFSGIIYDQTEIDSYVTQLQNLTLKEISFPHSMAKYIKDVAQVAAKDQEDMEFRSRVSRREFEILIVNLATLTLVFAHVVELKACSNLPLAFDLDRLLKRSSIYEQLFDGDPIKLKESTIFYHIGGLLVGSQFVSVDCKKCFLLSDFGWSVFLDCCDDSDPATIRPELVHIRRGVPTNAKTHERKSRIEDFPTSIGSLPMTTLLDRGAVYTPRCAMGVIDRTEYYTSRTKTFLLHIRFVVDHRYEHNSQRADTYLSYRKLHRSLWNVYPAKSYARCTHPRSVVTNAKLGLGVATAKGYGWTLEGREQGIAKVPERICISLVAGDPRARWLALEDASGNLYRRTVLRGEDCCEDCALEYASTLPGKVLLVL